MLPEIKWMEQELIPQLREGADQTKNAAIAQLEVWAGKAKKPLLLLHCPHPDEQRLPDYNLEEIHWNPEKMFVRELKGALSARFGGQAAVPSVRSSMGCGIYPTLFGLAQMIFPDKMPWLQEHLTKEQLLQMTADDIRLSPEFLEGLKQMRYMKEMLTATGVELYPMDLQGTIDISHLVIGDAFFYELYDDENFINHLLNLTVRSMILGIQEVMKIIDPQSGFVAHYSSVVLPASHPLKISEDTTTLISKEHIEQYALPSTRRVLEHFGGGYMHYCGFNQHLLEAAYGEDRLIGLNFGDPDKHDMNKVLRRIAATGKTFYGSINPTQGESRDAFFARVIRESTAQDGTAHLLLNYSCTPEDHDYVLAAWDKAGGNVM